jgi:OPA family glycerol-3-phosphate transporter-like MFS transporter 3
MVDVGSFVGGMVIGYLGDYFSYRALFLSPGFFLSALFMVFVAYANIHESWIYYVMMFFIGIMAGGPYNIIGTAITIDIGESIGKKNTAKISALIEGSAALFAAVSQIAISFIPK